MVTLSKALSQLSIAGLALGALTAFSVAASAGQCPADKMGVDVTKPVDYKAEGVKDEVLAALPLGETNVGVSDRMFRVRQLTIQPGGIVPWHSHADRPAIIYVVSGTIVEHASNCSVPIVHSTGEATVERKEVSHWWKNESDKVVILTSSDLLKDPNDKNM